MSATAPARTGGEWVVAALRAEGVRHVFGIPGVHNLAVYDALLGQSAIRHVLARHEQGAAFMADGYARSSRSEEHTSELQSHHDLVCRLLLEKKKIKKQQQHDYTTPRSH